MALILMHLSLSTSTYLRSGNGWGFVVICQYNLSPGLGYFSMNFIVFGISIQNVGDMQHKIVPRGREFVKQLLQIPNNPHPCLTWGRFRVTMIGTYHLIICTVAWLALHILLCCHRTFHNQFPCEQSSRNLLECDVIFD